MKNNSIIKTTAIAPILITLLSTPFVVQAEENLSDALTGGKLIANIQARYEFVDQDGISENAHAKTIRARLGYMTGTYYGFSALAEIDGTTHFGGEEFNSLENGKTTYPVVADPDSFRLNRANLKYTGFPETTLKAGRQRIILDDARFVGNVGWRQNEQTFDAFRGTNESIDGLKFNYAYLWRVNGITGSEHPRGEYDSDSHLFDVTYSGLDFADITAFGHWLDFEDAFEATSLATYGVRLKGSTMMTKDLKLLYAATFAHQADHGENTADVDENYYAAEAGLSYMGFTGKLGYEVLEGDGTVAFQTPLATKHKFQGFADVFLTTPADGVEDLYASLTYKSKPFAFLSKGLTVSVAFHDFEGNNDSTDMGSEIDAVLVVPFYDNFKAVTKYANYDGDGFASDRQKFMFAITYNY